MSISIQYDGNVVAFGYKATSISSNLRDEKDRSSLSCEKIATISSNFKLCNSVFDVETVPKN